MSRTYDFLKQCNSFFVTTINGAVPAARPFGASVKDSLEKTKLKARQKSP